MRCEEVIELMQRHLDHDLDDDETKRMRNHADACSECTEMLSRLERLNQDLENLPRVLPAYSIVDSIMPKLQEIDAASADDVQAAAIEQLEEERVTVIPPRRARRSYRAPAWKAAGAAAAALLLGVMIFDGLPRTYKDQSNNSMSGSPEAGVMSAESSLDAASAADSAAEEEVFTIESAGVAEERESGTESAFTDPDTPVSSTDGDNTATDKDHNDVRVKEVPSSREKEDAGERESASRDDKSVPPNGQNQQESAADAAPVPPAEPDKRQQHGIAAEPAETPPALQDGGGHNHKGLGGPGESAKRPEAFANKDSSLAAFVETHEDGNLAVSVTNKDGEKVFVSERLWPGDTGIRFGAWSGTVVTYTVTTSEFQKTYAIDVSAGTETEVTP